VTIASIKGKLSVLAGSSEIEVQRQAMEKEVGAASSGALRR